MRGRGRGMLEIRIFETNVPTALFAQAQARHATAAIPATLNAYFSLTTTTTVIL